MRLSVLALAGLLLGGNSLGAEETRRYVVVFTDEAHARSFSARKAITDDGNTVQILRTESRLETIPGFQIFLPDGQSMGRILTVIAEQPALEVLRQQPGVSYVVEDETFVPFLDRSVKHIGAHAAAERGITGAGYSVAVLDTGIDRSHPFLSGRVVLEACFSSNDPDRNIRSACPDGSTQQIGPFAALPPSASIGYAYHGTHVAGIAAGPDGKTARGRIDGVASGADIVAIQVFYILDSPTQCFPSASPCLQSGSENQVRALEFIKEVGQTYNVAAVNLSLGAYPARLDCDDSGFKTIFDQLTEMGIAVVAAAGNNGDSAGLALPACVSTAISVGAVDNSDVVQDFSNSSGNLDILAPGKVITSSTPGNGYIADSGTSMAAPHVAGSIALLRGLSAAGTVAEIEQALKKSGRKVHDARNNISVPRLDVTHALELLQ
jgi:subtilisin family serine protease